MLSFADNKLNSTKLAAERSTVEHIVSDATFKLRALSLPSHQGMALTVDPAVFSF